MDDAVERHRRACDGFARVAHAVPPQRWSAPTPCTEWTAGEVVEHVIGFHEFLILRPLGVRARRPRDDPAARWDATATALFTALDVDGTLDRATELPDGATSTPRTMLDALTTDVLVHTWDLARATALPAALDEELCTRAYAGIRASGLRRDAAMVGPEVAIAGDAPIADRLSRSTAATRPGVRRSRSARLRCVPARRAARPARRSRAGRRTRRVDRQARRHPDRRPRRRSGRRSAPDRRARSCRTPNGGAARPRPRPRRARVPERAAGRTTSASSSAISSRYSPGSRRSAAASIRCAPAPTRARSPTTRGSRPGSVALPWATDTGAAALLGYVSEITVHTWDVARATGQDPEWNDDVLVRALDLMRSWLPGENRTEMYAEVHAKMGPEAANDGDPFAEVVPVPADAPLIDRLVAWNGRRP